MVPVARLPGLGDPPCRFLILPLPGPEGGITAVQAGTTVGGVAGTTVGGGAGTTVGGGVGITAQDIKARRPVRLTEGYF